VFLYTFVEINRHFCLYEYYPGLGKPNHLAPALGIICKVFGYLHNALTLCITPKCFDIVQHNRLHFSFHVSFLSTITQIYLYMLLIPDTRYIIMKRSSCGELKRIFILGQRLGSIQLTTFIKVKQLVA